MDYEANTATRKIEETIHSLSNNNHMDGISYRLPHIWFPALKLKGGSEVNTSFNQNEETNNQNDLFLLLPARTINKSGLKILTLDC